MQPAGYQPLESPDVWLVLLQIQARAIEQSELPQVPIPQYQEISQNQS